MKKKPVSSPGVGKTLPPKPPPKPPGGPPPPAHARSWSFEQTSRRWRGGLVSLELGVSLELDRRVDGVGAVCVSLGWSSRPERGRFAGNADRGSAIDEQRAGTVHSSLQDHYIHECAAAVPILRAPKI